MREVNCISFVIAEEGNGDNEPVEEAAVVEKKFDQDGDVTLLRDVAHLLRLGPWLPCSMESRESFAGRLVSLGEKLGGFEGIEPGRKEHQDEVERLREVHAEEIQRMRKEHAEEVAKIRREFEMELEGEGGRRAARTGPETLVLAEVEPKSSSSQVPPPDKRRKAEATLSITDPAEDSAPEASKKLPRRRSTRGTAGGGGGAEKEGKKVGGGKNGKAEAPATPAEVPGASNVRRSVRRQSSNPRSSSPKIAAKSKTISRRSSVPAKGINKATSGPGLSSRPRRSCSRATSKLSPQEPSKRGKTEPVRAISFKCGHCGSCLSSLKNLRRHVKQIHEEPVSGRFICTEFYCLEQFSSNQYLQIHLKTHAENELFKCPTCGKRLANKWSYVEHLKTHESNRRRDFKCSTCSKGYFTQSDLNKHKKIHRPERPFRCPQCPKTFKSNHELQLHLVVHSESRPYSCEHCDRRFKRLNELVLHLRVHTGERPFSCEICQQSFSRSDHLKDHIRRIHAEDRVEKERPFKCPVCGVGFVRKWLCKKHQQDRHPGEFASGGDEAATAEGTRMSLRRRTK